MILSIYILFQCDIGRDTDEEDVELGSPHAFGGSPQIKESSFDEDAQARLAVLSYEQICRLNDVMEETVSFSSKCLLMYLKMFCNNR